MMTSTTLITFMLNHSTAQFVELFGSWDNFSEPWEMQRDSRRGWGNWTGCHQFRNIICDGDSVALPKKREFGLLMGGTYWYYYRINGIDEYHDPLQPVTTNCPLLPGQFLNVLEVPWEKHYISRSRSSSVSLITEIHTLNPDDRYLTPRPAPKPSLPKLMTKLDSSEFRSWSAAPPASVRPEQDLRQVKSASSLPTDIFGETMEQYANAARMPGVGHRGHGIKVNTGLSPVESYQTRGLGLSNLSSPISPKSQPWAYSSPTSSRSDTDWVPTSYHRRNNTEPILPPSSSISSVTDWIPTAYPRMKNSEPAVKEGGPLRFHLAELPKRAATARDVRPPVEIPHRRAWSHGTTFWSKSRSRDPSPLRTTGRPEREPIIPPWDIPYMITEVDEVPSPPRKSTTKPHLHERSQPSSSTNSVTASDVTGRPPTALRTPVNVPNVNKDLPALPTYLIPSPLFSPRGPGSEGKEDYPVLEESQDQKDFFLDWNFQQSRFSAWSIEEDLLADYAEFSSDGGEAESVDGADDKSLTYSSVRTSAQTSPLGHSYEATHGQTFDSLDWYASSPTGSGIEDRGGENKGLMTDSQPDASKAQQELERNQTADERHMTTWDELFDEFDYLGTAV